MLFYGLLLGHPLAFLHPVFWTLGRLQPLALKRISAQMTPKSCLLYLTPRFIQAKTGLPVVHVAVFLGTYTQRRCLHLARHLSLPVRNGAIVTRYHWSRNPQSTAGHGRWGVSPTPRHWPRPPVMVAHQSCPCSSPLKISRSGGSVVRPVTCEATHRALEEHCRRPKKTITPFLGTQGAHCLCCCASLIHSYFRCPAVPLIASPQFDAPLFSGPLSVAH